MLERTNPEYIYSVTPKPIELEDVKFYRELPLGEGGVNFDTYLRALEEIGYRGFLTIEREAGEDPAKDIGIAKDHLLKVIAEN